MSFDSLPVSWKLFSGRIFFTVGVTWVIIISRCNNSNSTHEPSSLTACSLSSSPGALCLHTVDMSSLSSGSRRPSSVSGFSVASFKPTGCSHGKDAVVFCDTCSMPLCEECLTNVEHRSHKFKTMEEVCNDKLEKIAVQLEDCKGRSQSQFQELVESQVIQLERDFQQVQDSFTEQYRELDDLLNHTKEHAVTLLEAQRQGQKKPLYVLAEEGDRYKMRADKLQTDIADLRQRVSSGADSMCILEIQAHQMSIDLIDEFYKEVTQNSKFDKSRLEALEKSIQHIVEKIVEIFPRPWEFYEDITFNPNPDKTNDNLMISDDYAQVFLSPQRSSPKVPYQTRETPFYVLGKQSWKKGQHYWEVDVGHCRTWAVGVVELANGSRPPSQAALMRLGRNKRSWMLESEDGELTALHNDNLSMVKQPEQEVTRLGVYLDMTKNNGRLSFYDVSGGAVLHTFRLRVKKSVFPAFSLTRVDGQLQSLVLCNLGLKPENETENETESEDSGVDTSSRRSSATLGADSSDVSGYSSDYQSPRSSLTTSL
ncbi:tripartite motif-containing protein 14-like [Alosa sapidissima]|uniref:tripartite motif-containing protein 14-like n=1 Tax=Alosa sapidissima TaxID=34773 RepID=UPI001C0875DB|nr:tripartite motif-containing protein 14-like [Alosa sapidissima]